ncbi:ABC transporter permease subunit [Nostoc sp. FACHB-87]|uniref:ABC transporter permease n=1 Tax=Nostocales TaxID=1161 RepID=UPI00168467BE|nr:MULTISPECIES: ABC transporter permease subunit [Nostocales]MBD2302649.1 ABC transporter permease subunit [Nostoc sp. FACHB-190]MBD2459152.1 ABC transporter permease subunit [Nostoc sp. FACHB-87]MBD2478995.1 ABC transporter permease subunit [Anabaena sp. FACHB-83]MBD2491882.1 ABC transporter permease subunit [Aulosira sp. FACHB-615]
MRTFVIAKNVFQEVVRDRILYVIGFYTLVLAIAWRVLPEFAATTENKMILDFGIVAINVISLIVAVFIGTGLVKKEIDKRTILVLIAKPVSRSEIIAGKFLGLSAVLAVLISTMTAIYLGFLQIENIPHPTLSIVIAAVFLFLQISLINAVAITLGVFTNALLAITLTFAVYLMGNISQDVVKFGRLSQNPTMERITQGLYLILPDLSRLDLKNDAVYGMQALPNATILITNAAYGVLYCIMLLAIASFVFSKREF